MRHCGGDVQQIHLWVRRLTLLLRVWYSPDCRYPELRKLEIKQLARTLLSGDSSPALHALKDKIKAYAGGRLPHAKDILSALYELMETDEAFGETNPPAWSPALSKQATAGDNWERLKDILTWSLKSGSFLDSQFYAPDSKPRAGVPVIRPIYFCSMIGGTFLPKLVKCGFYASVFQEYH